MTLTEQLSSRDEVKQAQVSLDLQAVLSEAHGRRLLWMILERCGSFSNAFTGEEAPTNFRLGEQNIGLWLISLMDQVDPKAFPRLMLAMADEREEEKRKVHVLDLE